MLKKNKLFLIIISEFLFLTIILLILPSLFIQERPGNFQTNYQNNLSLDTKNSYIQEVATDRNNLSGVSLLFKNPGLINKSHVSILVLDQNKSVLRSLITSGVSIGDPSWITFKFPYIPSSKGDKFFIRVTSDNTQAESLFLVGNINNKSFNFKTFYETSGFKESFKNTLVEQINRFNQRSISSNAILVLLFILLNAILFFSL